MNCFLAARFEPRQLKFEFIYEILIKTQSCNFIELFYDDNKKVLYISLNNQAFLSILSEILLFPPFNGIDIGVNFIRIFQSAFIYLDVLCAAFLHLKFVFACMYFA
jgi:hypothetical protein